MRPTHTNTHREKHEVKVLCYADESKGGMEGWREEMRARSREGER